MPYVHLRTDRRLDENALRELRQAILEDLAQYLSKPSARCMVQIDAAQCIAMGDGEAGCAFAEIRVQGRLDAAASDVFAAAFKQDVAAHLALKTARVYLQVLETQNGEVWGSIY